MTNTFDVNITFERTSHWFRVLWQSLKIWSDLFFVLMIFALYFVYQNYQLQTRMQLAIAPQVNDFYFVDYHQIEPSSDAKFRYLPLKILAVSDNEIHFKVGNIGHEKAVPISTQVKFDAPMRRNYYRAEELLVSREVLASWLESGIIYDIARPQNIYINGWIVMKLSDLQQKD